jgi:hypothetical protein
MIQSLQSLQECVVLCRPRNVIPFTIRYFHDEAQPYPTVNHAYHCLPYLLYEENTFRAYACTIYSHELSLLGSNRDTLDSTCVLRAVQSMVSEEFVISDSIRQLMTDYVEPIHEFSFSAFLCAIRLPLCCGALSDWARAIFEDYKFAVGAPLSSSVEPAHLGVYVTKL